MKDRPLLAALTLVALAILTWQLRWVLLILFGAIVISVGLDVLIQKIQSRIDLPRPFCLIIVLTSLTLFGVIISFLLLPELVAQIQELRSLFPVVIEKLKTIISNETRIGGLEKSLTEQFDWENIQPISSQIIGFAGGAANGLIQLFIATLIAILLALDPHSHRKMLISITPRPARVEMEDLLNQCRLALGGWLTGMTISASSIFILTWTGLTILKVPLALISALVCGLLTFVPTIGPTAATLIPLGVALMISPALMIEVLIYRVFLQNFEAFLLTPILLRRTVNLLPTVALIAQLSLGALLGIPGLLLALPLTVVLQVITQKVLVRKVMDRWD